MFWPDGGLNGWGGVAMTISMLLFWGLLILGAVLLVRALNRPPTSAAPEPRPSPQQVLTDRFARGEIDEDEYRRRLDALSSTGRTPTA